MKKYFGVFLLGAALVGPVSVPTMARPDDNDHHYKRYYDQDGRDYHEWNEREQRAYRHWYSEQHRDYVDWNRLNEQQRREYWRWRHEHTGDFPERTDMPRRTE